MASLGGRVRTREAQWRWMGYAGAGGGALALVAWLSLSGPVARVLPAARSVPERTAAAALGQDRWAAGERMMRSADEAAWLRLRLSHDLVAQNRNVIEACWKRAEGLRRSAPCEVRVGD